MTATSYGRTTVVRTLLENKTLQINAKSTLNENALFRAANSGHLECLKLLVEAGEDLNVLHVQNVTPLEAARLNNFCECYEYLLLQGAH